MAPFSNKLLQKMVTKEAKEAHAPERIMRPAQPTATSAPGCTTASLSTVPTSISEPPTVPAPIAAPRTSSSPALSKPTVRPISDAERAAIQLRRERNKAEEARKKGIVLKEEKVKKPRAAPAKRQLAPKVKDKTPEPVEKPTAKAAVQQKEKPGKAPTAKADTQQQEKPGKAPKAKADTQQQEKPAKAPSRKRQADEPLEAISAKTSKKAKKEALLAQQAALQAQLAALGSDSSSEPESEEEAAPVPAVKKTKIARAAVPKKEAKVEEKAVKTAKTAPTKKSDLPLPPPPPASEKKVRTSTVVKEKNNTPPPATPAQTPAVEKVQLGKKVVKTVEPSQDRLEQPPPTKQPRTKKSGEAYKFDTPCPPRQSTPPGWEGINEIMPRNRWLVEHGKAPEHPISYEKLARIEREAKEAGRPFKQCDFNNSAGFEARISDYKVKSAEDRAVEAITQECSETEDNTDPEPIAVPVKSPEAKAVEAVTEPLSETQEDSEPAVDDGDDSSLFGDDDDLEAKLRAELEAESASEANEEGDTLKAAPREEVEEKPAGQEEIEDGEDLEAAMRAALEQDPTGEESREEDDDLEAAMRAELEKASTGPESREEDDDLEAAMRAGLEQASDEEVESPKVKKTVAATSSPKVVDLTSPVKPKKAPVKRKAPVNDEETAHPVKKPRISTPDEAAPIVKTQQKKPAPAPIVKTQQQKPAPAPIVKTQQQKPAPAPIVKTKQQKPAPNPFPKSQASKAVKTAPKPPARSPSPPGFRIKPPPKPVVPVAVNANKRAASEMLDEHESVDALFGSPAPPQRSKPLPKPPATVLPPPPKAPLVAQPGETGRQTTLINTVPANVEKKTRRTGVRKTGGAKKESNPFSYGDQRGANAYLQMTGFRPGGRGGGGYCRR